MPAQPAPDPEKIPPESEGGEGETPERVASFGSLTVEEASRKGVEARRKKAQEREQTAQENALTFRQRVGVSLSKLSQRDLDGVIKRMAHQGNTSALARMADQAFGRPQQADEDAPGDESLAQLSREERAQLRAMLDGDALEDEAAQLASADPPTPAGDEPLRGTKARCPPLHERLQLRSLQRFED